MSGVNLDLNSLPEEGPPTDATYEYVGTLSKDGVMVSPVAVRNLPLRLPSTLNFSRYEAASLYSDNLPGFELHPHHSPPNRSMPDRRHEWKKFLNYLHGRDKVVPIIVDGWELLIKPPRFPPNERSSVRVCYRKLQNGPAAAKQMPPTPPPRVAPATPQPGPAPGIIRPASEEVPDPPGKVPVKPISSDPRRLGQMHPSYLQTLAQLHASWQFGALAELVDNARDAQATGLSISINMVKMKGKVDLIPLLRIEDNGRGMNHEEIVRMLQFGHKRPDNKDQIGHFGVGFKTGSMRLGKDVVVLTQSKDSRSIGFLSTSYNENKEVLEIPIVTYRKEHGIMELDLSVQSEEQGLACLQAVKTFSPFNEFEIGSLFDKIGDGQNGTHIFIYNLDRWGKEYALQWDDEERNRGQWRCDGDITIRSKRVRARPSQTSKEIPLDYSLRSYLEVLFLDPRMIIRIQGIKVKTKRLSESLHKTVRKRGTVCDKKVELTLGRSSIEFNRGNCGIFLYWHGRLIEAYKRVGGMVHSADVGRGVIGVIDVTALMEHEDGRTSVLNTKQSFEDCEEYAMLEKWLGEQVDNYWNTYFDKLEVVRDADSGEAHFEQDRDWVQCDKCRKWRKLPQGVHSGDLPEEWFCYMQPCNKNCSVPEEKADDDIVTVGVNRTNMPTTTPSTPMPTPKVEVDTDDEDLATPIGTLFKRQPRKSVAGATSTKQVRVARTRESPPPPKPGNMSPVRKRLRKRN